LSHVEKKTIGGLAKDYHIIGHSLGGHIAGYAGERIEHLGRITGIILFSEIV